VAGRTDALPRHAAAAILVVLAVVCGTPTAGADPDALWNIVNGKCVPNQEQNADPAPCAKVDLDGRYAVLKDLVGATQFLLIPTERVDGIESPQILAADAPNYFAAAWRARTFVEQRAGRALPRDWMSLAINSATTRTQNELHIHVDCVRADVHAALAANAGDIGEDWAPFPTPLAGQRYRAMAVWDSDLDTVNPFRVLAASLPAPADMGAQTLAVVGVFGADGRPGFVLLAGRADTASADSGSGEDLQDHAACPPQAEVMGK
jgi:CDP-diacylglycerol pyrophosphatase